MIGPFSRASIVISPHGAAQTNMLWMEPGTAVVEFHVRNNAGIFAHMALSMGLEFWDLSEIGAAYFKDFRMTPPRVELVLNVVDHIMKSHTPNKWTLPAVQEKKEKKEKKKTSKKSKKAEAAASEEDDMQEATPSAHDEL